MNINNIRLLNFRCFEDTPIRFNKELTVIVGNNGAGKSSVLDAIAISMGSFIAGIDGVQSNSISKYDVRFASYELGSVIDRQPQFPVGIHCEANLGEEILTWNRALNSENGRTTIVDAKQIMEYADGLQQNVRRGDRNTILPIVSYYGTGRLWAQKKQKRSSSPLQSASRFAGYIDCLDIMSNEKLMLKWFKKMTLIELQEKRGLPELRAIIGALKKSLAGVLSENGQTMESNFFYEIKTDELIVTYKDSHGELEKHPLRELSDGYRNTLSIIADILIVTGHDSMKKNAANPNSLDNYSKSRYYIQSVREARKYEPSLDKLCVFAGACQSYYEGLMGAGANFASSPGRILIHALDPAKVGDKVAFTDYRGTVTPGQIAAITESGSEGIGGIKTKGHFISNIM